MPARPGGSPAEQLYAGAGASCFTCLHAVCRAYSAFGLADDGITILLAADGEAAQGFGYGSCCPIRHMACMPGPILRIARPAFRALQPAQAAWLHGWLCQRPEILRLRQATPHAPEAYARIACRIACPMPFGDAARKASGLQASHPAGPWQMPSSAAISLRIPCRPAFPGIERCI